MARSFNIGVNRNLEVNADGSIVIEDTQSSAEALFSKARWSAFIKCVSDIDVEVKKLKESKEFKFSQHYGGAWHVSVTSGIRCVDLRRFYMDQCGQIRPTRHGIGLRLQEWETLKELVGRWPEEVPEHDYTTGCYHPDVEDWFKCEECFPFRTKK